MVQSLLSMHVCCDLNGNVPHWPSGIWTPDCQLIALCGEVMGYLGSGGLWRKYNTGGRLWNFIALAYFLLTPLKSMVEDEISQIHALATYSCAFPNIVDSHLELWEKNRLFLLYIEFSHDILSQEQNNNWYKALGSIPLPQEIKRNEHMLTLLKSFCDFSLLYRY